MKILQLVQLLVEELPQLEQQEPLPAPLLLVLEAEVKELQLQ